MPRKSANQSPAPRMAHTRRKFFGAGKGRGAGYIYPAGGTRAQNADVPHGRDVRRRDGPAGMRGSVAEPGENAGIVAEPVGMRGSVTDRPGRAAGWAILA